MTRHIDVLALLLIVLGMLVISKASELRVVRNAGVAGIRIQNAVSRMDVCPLTKALIRFR